MDKSKIILVVLLILAGVLFFQNKNLKWELIYENAVPDVELINYLTFDSNNIASGSLTGFVVFDDKEKQPKELKQYVQITASNDTTNGRQIFYLVDIIKMDVLPPRYFDPVALIITNTTNGIITLSDSNNNLYQIDKNTGEVSMFDNTKDIAKLITSDSEFRDFMVTFLK